MGYGCLAGTGVAPLVTGSYGFYGRGSSSPLYSENDHARAVGPWPLGSGVLFGRSSECRLEWSRQIVGDTGLDLEVTFDHPVFVDHVITRFDCEDGDAAVERVELFAEAQGETLRCVGTATGEGGSPIAGNGVRSDRTGFVIGCGETVSRIVLRIHTCFRNLVITACEIWGADESDAPVYPFPGCLSPDANGILDVSGGFASPTNRM